MKSENNSEFIKDSDKRSTMTCVGVGEGMEGREKPRTPFRRLKHLTK